MNRFFVTATDTGVGKTEVSCALLAEMASRGLTPFAWKPCESGGTGDSRALWEAAGRVQPFASVCTYRFKAPLAPSLAAARERKRVDWRHLLKAFGAFEGRAGVVEGAGGVHVPLTARRDVIDLLVELKLPTVLVARAGLGTINHTHLSLEALMRRKVEVCAVVLSRGTGANDPSVKGNRAELERRFPRVRFIGPLPFVDEAAKRRSMFRRELRSLVVPSALG